MDSIDGLPASRVAVTARLIHVVHGWLDATSSHAASLIVVEIYHGSRRAQRAEIHLRLEALGASRRQHWANDFENLERYWEDESEEPSSYNIGNERTIQAEKVAPSKTIANSGIKVSSSIRDERGPNPTAVWSLNTASAQDEIPESIRLAILLTRNFQSGFIMAINTRFRTLEVTFQQMIGSTETIRFDPTNIYPEAQDDVMMIEINPRFLSNVNLEALVSDFLTGPEFPTGHDVEQDEKKALDKRSTLEAKLASVSGTVPEPTPGPEPGVGPRLQGRGDGTFALMWGDRSMLGLGPTTTIDPAGEELRTDLEHFEGIPAKKWRRKPDYPLLLEYFPWLNPKSQVGDRVLGGAGAVDTSACVLLFQKLNANGVRGFRHLNELLSNEDILPTLKIMGLTRKNLNTRLAESGSCFHQTVRGGKAAEIYVVQTPTYGDEFWYLIILATEPPRRAAAVLYVDSDINAADIIHEVHKQATSGPHYLYLLLELFEDHFKRTSVICDSVVNIINDIDKFLESKLNKENGAAANDRANTLDTARELSEKTHQLHRARTNLVRLRRRRDFERKITSALNSSIDSWSQLSERIAICISLASNRDVDLNDLPRRIESQSSVIAGLVAQQDAQLQYGLTLSAVKDSKGMVTLSAITIFFLPGAFVAGLFSTNMFDFATLNQEVGIYFGIVIPLTGVLFWVWKLWLGYHPVVPLDLEFGGRPTIKEKNQ